MTEFQLSENCKLGIILNKEIAKILADKTPHYDKGKGTSKFELYFHVENIELKFDNAIKNCIKLSLTVLIGYLFFF
ncbi:MAG TPA: hypothetical protein PK073_03940 [Ignavibacteriaceae bacterium]|jgi:hypothetical protein|nr:MAG: hypothetical protein B6D44_02560 [Ignavibacteriales bacterium UTCHB2]HQF42042.1 hypothetical protein [Ignavibacteriaceae bacterium]HQI40759.1 hypothetical protein [Ignavibacteriaceae bacterium]